MDLNFLQDKEIAILGYGLEGKSTVQFLLAQGIEANQLTILDKNKEIAVPQGCQMETGSNYLDNLETFDYIFKSPGITLRLLEEQTGKVWRKEQFLSQTQLFFDLYDGIIIGITGTKGKTTMSTVLQQVLEQAGKKVVLAGNIGKPVLDIVNFDNSPEIVVYEISSFMLESLDEFQLDIGVFNTLYPTHTSEHGGYENYVAAKARLLNHSEQLLIGYQAEEALGNSLQDKDYISYGKTGKYTWTDGQFMIDGMLVATDEAMQIPGVHNRYNMCGLIGVGDILASNNILYLENYMIAFQNVLANFQGVEHRLESVGVYAGITWINDAIATTPQATMAAIESFGEQIDTLFYGGIDGEYDHNGVAKLICKYHIKNLILFPDTGEQLEKLLCHPEPVEGCSINDYNIFYTRSMSDAVQRAKEHTKPGKIALLSCGSPSFSCWKNFKEKGRLFKEEARKG